jgi:hypothetical protein
MHSELRGKNWADEKQCPFILYSHLFVISLQRPLKKETEKQIITEK